MSTPASPQFYTYTAGQFHKADVTRYFGGKAKSTADIVATIKAEGYDFRVMGRSGASVCRPDHQRWGSPAYHLPGRSFELARIPRPHSFASAECLATRARRRLIGFAHPAILWIVGCFKIR